MEGNSFYITTTNCRSKKEKKTLMSAYILIGAYDGAEVCELIGIFMLSILSKHINKNYMGLHRNGDPAFLTKSNCRRSRKIQEKVSKLFKQKDLEIIVQCN